MVFLQQVINALSLGGTFALLALGLAIVFSILGLINFAHGELMTITGYTMFFGLSAGLPFWLASLLGVIVAIVSAVLMERIAFRPLRGAGTEVLLLASFGVSVILHVLFQDLISARPKPIQVPASLSGYLSIGDLDLGKVQLLSIILTVIVLAALTAFLKRTTIGLSMRAAATDFAVTRLMGVRANAVIAIAFAISGLLAGVAAILYVSQRGTVDPFMGFLPVLSAFVAAVLGGLGSLSGAVMGGFLLAALEVGFDAFLPDGALPYKVALTFAVVIGVLLWRPSGLLTKRGVAFQ